MTSDAEVRESDKGTGGTVGNDSGSVVDTKGGVVMDVDGGAISTFEIGGEGAGSSPRSWIGVLIGKKNKKQQNNKKQGKKQNKKFSLSRRSWEREISYSRRRRLEERSVLQSSMF